MPIFWRYLFREFFKIFTLSLMGLIVCLLITRLQDIAHFATLAGNFRLTTLFTLCQIPYILPFALPISALIASMLLFQKLCTSHELTALRSAGLSLKTIKTPLKFIAFFLALINLLIVSELTPITRHKGFSLLQEVTTQNPLLLLEKNKQIKIKNSYIDMESLEIGKEIKNLIFVLNQNGRLSLITAESLKVSGAKLLGTHLTYITSEKDDLMIENQSLIEMDVASLSPLLSPKVRAVKTEHYPLKPLIQKLFEAPLAKTKYEVMRRFFFPLLTITFMFLGMSFGCQIGRNKSSRALKTLSLATYALLCFLVSKSQHKHPELSALFLLILPHLPLLYLAKRAEKRVNLGIG